MEYVQELLQTESRIEAQRQQRRNVIFQKQVWNSENTIEEYARLQREKILHKFSKSDDPMERLFAKAQIAF